MPNPIQSIGNNIRLIKADGTATDFFIRWAQQRQIDISSGITAAQAQQLIDDWAAARDITVGTGLSGGGNLSADVNISLGPVLLAYAGGDTPSAFTASIVDSVDAAAWRAAIGAGTGGGTVTSVDGASSASGFTLSGGPIVGAGTLTFNISNAANARSSLGLIIGTNVQAFSTNLAAYAGGDTPSAFTLGIVDSVDAAAWRAAIGAGTSTVTPAALTKTDDINVTLVLGGTPATALLQAASLTLGWTGTLSVARGGTGSGTAGGARTNLGLVIGTDIQAFSSNLAAYAGGDTPSAFTLGIVDSVDAAAWRAAIGAGTSTVTPAAVTKTDDTNVTLTLGGTPATAALQAFSITLGWTGTLSIARGGTGSGTAAAAPWVQKSGDTMTGSLNFSGSGRRITADFSDSLATNRGAFQSNVANGITAVGILPNGTSTQAQLMVFNNSDPDNASLMNFVAQATELSFRSGATGTGTTLPLAFYVGGVKRATFTTAGDLEFAGSTIVDSNRIFRLRQYTVATLPTVGTAGRLASVTDALAPTFLTALVGGGAINTMAYDNGTNWTAH
jgi:hypothetical protein